MGEEIKYTREINPKEVKPIYKNKSVFFILPFLGEPSYWYYGLINCFLGDETNKPQLTLSKIFIQVKYYDVKLTNTKYFNQFYKLEDNTYMYVYDIPKQYEVDYIRFYRGEYSKMSEPAKNIICKLSGIKPIMNSIVYKALYKTLGQREYIEELIGQKLKDSDEVYSKPNLDIEIYNSPIQMISKDRVREELLQE